MTSELLVLDLDLDFESLNEHFIEFELLNLKEKSNWNHQFSDWVSIIRLNHTHSHWVSINYHHHDHGSWRWTFNLVLEVRS